jgi:hypothetical protein
VIGRQTGAGNTVNSLPRDRALPVSIDVSHETARKLIGMPIDDATVQVKKYVRLSDHKADPVSNGERI